MAILLDGHASMVVNAPVQPASPLGGVGEYDLYCHGTVVVLLHCLQASAKSNIACSFHSFFLLSPHPHGTAACQGCSDPPTLPAGDSGRRQVQSTTGITMRNVPCANGDSVGTNTDKQMCQWVTWTGRKQPSGCGDGWCYTEVKLASGAMGWAQLSRCASVHDATIGGSAKSGASACQGRSPSSAVITGP